MRGKCTILALGVLAAALVSAAQPEDFSENSTVSDYLEYAALNNPGLESAFNNWKAELERVVQVKTLPDPKFTYAYYIEQVETRVGPQEQRLALSQTFPWFSKLSLEGNAAAETANVAKAQYDAARSELFYRVKVAFCEYYFLGRALAVTGEHFEIMKSIEGVARIGYQTGLVENGDLIKAQVELGRLEDRLSTLRDLRSPYSARLRAAAGLPPDGEPLPFPGSLDAEGREFSDEELVEWLRQSNPELKAINSKAAAQGARLSLAGKDWYPDVTLGVEYIVTGEADMDVEDSGKDPVIAMATINLPIWWKKYQAREAEYEYRQEAVTSQKADRENLLIAELKNASFNYRDAGRKIDFYGNALIPKSRQALAATLKSFAAGRQNFIDVAYAEQTLLDFELEYERARADRAIHLAAIEMLVGRELPVGEEGSQQGPSMEESP